MYKLIDLDYYHENLDRIKQQVEVDKRQTALDPNEMAVYDYYIYNRNAARTKKDHLWKTRIHYCWLWYCWYYFIDVLYHDLNWTMREIQVGLDLTYHVCYWEQHKERPRPKWLPPLKKLILQLVLIEKKNELYYGGMLDMLVDLINGSEIDFGFLTENDFNQFKRRLREEVQQVRENFEKWRIKNNV